MSELHPLVEPYDSGMLHTGDGHRLHWEVCGNPGGKPAVVLHGGPGSGAGSGWRRYFDPQVYRAILFDQRNCGRSLPHAAEPDIDLSTNTTQHLIADIERLRQHLGIERWLVLGGSWGTTLGLAYIEQHPKRASEAILFSIGFTSSREVDWITRDVGRVFPEAWERFRDGVPAEMRNARLVDAYSSLLHDPDPAVVERAARDWCAWEDAHIAIRPGHRPDPRYGDPRFRVAFARLVTHYWRHAAWLEDGALLRGASRLGDIPAVLIHGRLDFSSPLEPAWRLSRAWPGSELVIVDDAGHGAVYPGTSDAILVATAKFAGR